MDDEQTRVLTIPVGVKTARTGSGYNAPTVSQVKAVDIRFPMERLTAAQWDVLLNVLEAMRPVLAEMPPEPSATSEKDSPEVEGGDA